MFGLKYHRKQKRLMQNELAEMSGVATETISRLEGNLLLTTPCDTIYALAKALGVTMEEIIQEYPDDALSAGDHPPTESKTANPENCLSRYRQEKNLTFKELAERLGNSTREAGRKACARQLPIKKHVRKLAEFEGISVDEFYRTYSAKGDEVA